MAQDCYLLMVMLLYTGHMGIIATLSTAKDVINSYRVSLGFKITTYISIVVMNSGGALITSVPSNQESIISSAYT
jgi:hypothetical protein